MEQPPITTIKIHEVPQGGAEWAKIRCGKFTSSEIHRLMSEPKDAAAKKAGELSEGAKTYVLEKVHETLTGAEKWGIDNAATTWGIMNEPLARAWYEKKNGVEVRQVGFTEVSESFGGSVDGLVGEDGGLEIKCPYNGANHLENTLIEDREYMKKYFKEYYWQCVSNAFCNNRQWWDFVSFDPRIQHQSGYFQFRVHPPQEDIDLLVKKVAQAVELKLKLIEKFTK